MEDELRENNRLLKIIARKEFTLITDIFKIFGLLSALALLMVFGWMVELIQDYPEIHRVSITVTIGAVVGMITFILFLVDIIIIGRNRQKELNLR